MNVWLETLMGRKPKKRVAWTAVRAEMTFWQFVEQTGPIRPGAVVRPPNPRLFEEVALLVNEGRMWRALELFKAEVLRQAVGWQIAPGVIENLPPAE